MTCVLVAEHNALLAQITLAAYWNEMEFQPIEQHSNTDRFSPLPWRKGRRQRIAAHVLNSSQIPVTAYVLKQAYSTGFSLKDVACFTTI